MTTLEGAASKPDNFIDLLTSLSEKAYELAGSAMLNKRQRGAFSERAKKLKTKAQDLEVLAFKEKTAKFQEAKTSLDDLNRQVQNRLDALDDWAQKAQDVAAVLKLLDQALDVAAGLAGKV